MRGDLPQTGFRSSVAGILWKLKHFGGFTLQMCYIANLVILHWSKNKSAPSVLMLKQENCCIWRHRLSSDVCILTAMPWSLSETAHGQAHKQDEDLHAVRLQIWMFSSATAAHMTLLQKYHFLKKQAGDTPILFSLPSFLFVISQYASYVRIKVKGNVF